MRAYAQRQFLQGFSTCGRAPEDATRLAALLPPNVTGDLGDVAARAPCIEGSRHTLSAADAEAVAAWWPRHVAACERSPVQVRIALSVGGGDLASRRPS